jgi:anti-sigma-K factor RskA
MLRSVRYQNPKIREHLASQYAMGLLLPSVKRRVEKLMQQDASFEQEVIAWQERLSPLNDVPEPKPAPAFVKERVMAKIQGKPVMQTSKLQTWWQSLLLWQSLSAASLALLVVITVMPLTENTELVAKLSYIAVMQSDTTAGEAPLVVSAYAKTEDDPSRLELRWNDRTDRESVEQTTLWAIERETGNITPLMQLAAGMQSVNLDAQQWQAVKNSLELVVVKGTEFDGEVVLRGICIQLADWNKA